MPPHSIGLTPAGSVGATRRVGVARPGPIMGHGRPLRKGSCDCRGGLGKTTAPGSRASASSVGHRAPMGTVKLGALDCPAREQQYGVAGVNTTATPGRVKVFETPSTQPTLGTGSPYGTGVRTGTRRVTELPPCTKSGRARMALLRLRAPRRGTSYETLTPPLQRVLLSPGRLGSVRGFSA